MAFPTKRCPNCDAAAEREAEYCGACGGPGGAAFSTCPDCLAAIEAGSAYCWKCGARQDAHANRRVRYDQRWRRSPGVFALPIRVSAEEAAFVHGLQVDDGTLAMVFQQGICRGFLDPGFYPANTFWERLAGAIPGAALDAILLDHQAAQTDPGATALGLARLTSIAAGALREQLERALRGESAQQSQLAQPSTTEVSAASGLDLLEQTRRLKEEAARRDAHLRLDVEERQLRIRGEANLQALVASVGGEQGDRLLRLAELGQSQGRPVEPAPPFPPKPVMDIDTSREETVVDLFLSYSRRDQDRMLPLAEGLRAQGLVVWIDQVGIEGATYWAQEISQAIRRAKVFLLFASAASFGSPHVMREVSLACDWHKPILPWIWNQSRHHRICPINWRAFSTLPCTKANPRKISA